MALWKDSNVSVEPATTPAGTRTPTPTPPPVSAPSVVSMSAAAREAERTSSAPSVVEAPRRPRDMKESVIAADINIEGKIEGAGHVRIAGRFKGDVHVEGNLTIDAGAHLTGQVHANTAIVGGELQGNITAQRVELLETGVINGDVKASQLTVAAGSRMRGQVEFGWSDKGPQAKRPNGEVAQGPGRT
ncbi:MAG: bactofilin family protein [Gammaproteobacteria bacterium]